MFVITMGLPLPLFVLPVLLTLVFGQNGSGSNECLSNKDCPSDRLCAQFTCINPCLLNICDNPVNCRVTNHIPVCSTNTCVGGTIVRGSNQNTGVKKYRTFDTLLSWYKALLTCRSHGMTLATIESQQDQDRISDVIKPYGEVKWGFWIGASDLLAEAQFVWSSTNGLLVKYTNYYAGQPNNFKNANNETENCMEIRTSDFNYTWFDEVCSYEQRFVCEYFE